MIRRSWMMGASIETTLDLWASSLRDVKARIRGLFTQKRVAASANLFLDGLLGGGRWEANELRDIVRGYVVKHLATDDAVLVIDETSFLKRGKASCGVSRQYIGAAGKIMNCQIGMFAAYVSGRSHAFIDRALYLPKSWTSDRARLAANMIGSALFANVPFS